MIVGDLEAAHVSRISRILEAVLVALEEKLQLEPATILIEEHSGPESRRRDLLRWCLSRNAVCHVRLRRSE